MSKKSEKWGFALMQNVTTVVKRVHVEFSEATEGRFLNDK